jgi:hypothetical protein
MELKSSARNWSVESFACPSKEIALVATWKRDWNAVNAGSIQIEAKGTSPSWCSGTQIQDRVGRVTESRKVSVSVRIVLCSSETHLSSSRRQRSLKAENGFMSWGSLRKRESFPLARALCVPGERTGVQECVVLCSPTTEVQVVPATWRFRFFGCNFHIYSSRRLLPYPYWVGTLLGYPSRVG